MINWYRNSNGGKLALMIVVEAGGVGVVVR